MIQVRLERNAQGDWHGFRVEGHASFAQPGQDIVCAAVSMLAEACTLALRSYLGDGAEIRQSHGRLSCRWGEVPAALAGEVRGVMQAFSAGMEEVERHYPRNVRVVRKSFSEKED